jgi:hypothetical protein
MNFEIYKVVIGQVLRHFLSIAAAALGTYGVGEAQQGEVVEATIAIIVGVLVFLVAQGWSYASKRLAFLADPSEGE